jgi:hypothetical protein
LTFRIHRSTKPDGTLIFFLSGEFTCEAIGELERLLSAEPTCPIVLDFADVVRVDRDAVLFLVRCHTAGLALARCPHYIIEWMHGEQRS